MLFNHSLLFWCGGEISSHFNGYVKLLSHSSHRYHHAFTGAYSPGWTFDLPFRGFLITHIQRHTTGLLWTSDQPVAEVSTYTGQHNIYTQQTNILAPNGIRTCDPSSQAAADISLRPRGRWDRPATFITALQFGTQKKYE
jgi:hypothetical protein